MHYKKILHEILDGQNYLCLATANKAGLPWASPLAYVCDDDFSFYFLSNTESLHSRNIAENREVAFSIYDSNQTMRSAFGIQASGLAEQIDEWKVPQILKEKLLQKIALAVLSKDHSFYHIITKEMFFPDTNRGVEFHNMRVKIEV